jgi:hypothetical protein
MANTPPPPGATLTLYNTLGNALVDSTLALSPRWRGELKTALAQADRIAGDSTTLPSQTFNLKHTTLNPATLKAMPDETDAALAQMQQARQVEASRFLLLDLADFLSTTFSAQWQQLTANTPPPPGAVLTLYNTLENALVDSTIANSPRWRGELKTALAQADRIAGDSTTLPSQTFNLKHTTLNPATLKANLAQLIQAVPAPSQTPAPSPAPGQPSGRALPKFDGNANTHYVLRAVFQRPNCGPLRPDVVSDPTEAFAISSFFDFDAPSRPIRIAMPIDTSIKGLRKFNKNVGILISKQLREQMSSVTDLKKALDGNLASGEGFDLGVICSFSIPIITICALVVLLIFLILLNIVFWWLPFFRLCFPIALKAE